MKIYSAIIAYTDKIGRVLDNVPDANTILISAVYIKKWDLKRLKERIGDNKFYLDSGAFTVWKSGHRVDF